MSLLNDLYNKGLEKNQYRFAEIITDGFNLGSTDYIYSVIGDEEFHKQLKLIITNKSLLVDDIEPISHFLDKIDILDNEVFNNPEYEVNTPYIYSNVQLKNSKTLLSTSKEFVLYNHPCYAIKLLSCYMEPVNNNFSSLLQTEEKLIILDSRYMKLEDLASKIDVTKVDKEYVYHKKAGKIRCVQL